MFYMSSLARIYYLGKTQNCTKLLLLPRLFTVMQKKGGEVSHQECRMRSLSIYNYKVSYRPETCEIHNSLL